MKKVDIIKLKLKGVSNEEIKELMELEALAEDAEENIIDQAKADPATGKEEEDDDDEAPAEENKVILELQEALNEAKAQIIDLQKKNIKKDISSQMPTEDDDQEIFNKAIQGLM